MRDELFKYLEQLEQDFNPQNELHLIALICLFNSSYTVLIDDKEFIERLLELALKVDTNFQQLSTNNIAQKEQCNNGDCRVEVEHKSVFAFMPSHTRVIFERVVHQEV